MDESLADLDRAVSASALLGYLNFSDGRPDPRWQKQFHDVYALLADRGAARPWDALRQWLASRLETLHTAGTAAFRDVAQARTVPEFFAHVLPAYREHHADRGPLISYMGNQFQAGHSGHGLIRQHQIDVGRLPQNSECLSSRRSFNRLVTKILEHG